MTETLLGRTGERRDDGRSAGGRHRTGDAFTDGFLDQLPAEVADSFSREQLNAIRMVYGARLPTRHRVEQRHLLRVFGRSYYLVLLLGRASPKAEARAELATNPARRWAYRGLVLAALGAVVYWALLSGVVSLG